MKKKILIFVAVLFFSCEEKKTEFIQSRQIENLFLLKNPPNDDSIVKIIIKKFLKKNQKLKHKENNFPTYIYISSLQTQKIL